MKVLFVSSGNSKDGISPIVKNQGESLKDSGIDIQFYALEGKGMKNYLKNIIPLRKYIKQISPDIIHSHYTLSGWTSVLTFSGKPIILSLMGTDTYGDYIGHGIIKWNSYYLIILTLLIQPFVKYIICKSENIYNKVYLRGKSSIIPNGISIRNTLLDQDVTKKEQELNSEKNNILFLGDKTNIRKNYGLLELALKQVNSDQINLITPYPIPHTKVIKYLHLCDVLVMTSFMEGSPNIVKEAMACNCPVVATDVGDIRWLFGNEPGHFITTSDPENVAEKIDQALEFVRLKGRTNGKQRIIELGLDSESVAKRIIEVYEDVLKS
jgi:teichuronic acid biosynthesis glycosyltransferase TuaC